MAATRARPPPALQHRSVCGCRSSSASPAPAALPSYPSAGWSRGRSLGSAATTDWPKTSRQPSSRLPPWSTSPRSSSSPGASQELEIRRRFLGWAVRVLRLGRGLFIDHPTLHLYHSLLGRCDLTLWGKEQGHIPC